ncbi:hypothetical protein HWV62_6164 [Athelia sp. TMB]|nr:hypothetical protein HWV62_6164 [Athelia sp. TMB]
MPSQQSDKENEPQRAGLKRSADYDSALVLPPKKCLTDPIVHIGRHFGRTVSAVVNVKSLISKGIAREVRLLKEEMVLTDLALQEQQEHKVFSLLVEAVPDLLDRMEESHEAGIHLCAMLQKGIDNARSDDTKGLKGPIVDWITKPGESYSPPLFRHSKVERGFNHHLTGRLLCPAAWNWDDPKISAGLRSGEIHFSGEQWPKFLYEDCRYIEEEPWKNLFRGHLLVKAYKHIFTSPSSVLYSEPKSTRSGNASIHGMTEVMLASIAYVATQVRFSLSSQSTFIRSNCVTDTEHFYNTCMDLFLDPRERAETNDLLLWWNRKIFPTTISARMPIPTDTPLARIRAKRDAMEAAAAEAATAAATNTDVDGAGAAGTSVPNGSQDAANPHVNNA